MAESGQKPAPAGKRLCGICGKPLSTYNKDDICMSHKAEDVSRYRDKQANQKRESRAVLSFIAEFHKAGSVQEMFDAAKEAELSPAKRKAATDLERYPEAVGLLRVASLILHMPMPRILRKVSVSEKPKLARDVLTYIMRKDLGMKPDEIALFFGYGYLPRVAEGVERIQKAMLEDEDIIMAVDLIREEFESRQEL